MVSDSYEFFKSLWVVVGPLFGTHEGSPAFWADLKERFLAAWQLYRPVWEGEVDDWIALEDRCRQVGFQVAGVLVTLAVWRKNACSMPETCAQCGQRPTRRWNRRTLRSTCGKYDIHRQQTTCLCGTRIPADRALGLPEDDRVSPGLRKWGARLAASLPYQVAENWFSEWLGQKVISRQGLHDIVNAVGTALPELPDLPPATTPGTPPERMVLDADAAVVSLHHTAKKKDKEAAVEASQTPFAQMPDAAEAGSAPPAQKPKAKKSDAAKAVTASPAKKQLVAREYFEAWVGRTYERLDRSCGGKLKSYRHLAFSGGVARAGDDIALQMFCLVQRRFPGALTERIVFVRGDGGALIDRMADHFPNVKRLLDQYHTLVKVTERLKGAFRDMPKWERRALDDELSGLLKDGKEKDLRERLAALASHPKLQDPTALEGLGAHILKHKDHLWYPEAKALGIGVGTGITEKDVDLILDRRFELRGMSWSPRGLRDALRIRLTLFNDLPASLEQACRPPQPRPSS